MIVCLISIIIALASTILTPPKMTEAVIYKSETDPTDKIICEFYLTGITSDSPNWKLIQTKNQDAIIRKIEILDDLTTFEKLNTNGFPKKPPEIKKFEYKNTTYNIESYQIWKDWNNWEKYIVKE